MTRSNDCLWPRAQAGRRGRGRLRQRIEDFRVHEELNFEFTGSGEHLYLHVEKQNLTTREVQLLLASHFGVDAVHIGFAGMKDKRAIVRQWFSVHTPKCLSSMPIAGVRIIDSQRHARKLRRGAIAANHFQIVVREPTDIDTRNFGEPVPNYFGPQRFGSNRRNVHDAVVWLEQGRPRISAFMRSLYVSALRSFLFNEVLAVRIGQGNWQTPIEGDACEFDQPTGPLWGRGRLCTSAAAQTIEFKTAQQHAEISEALEWVGLVQERRPLAAQPIAPSVTSQSDHLMFGFALRKGQYATSVLREYVEELS